MSKLLANCPKNCSLRPDLIGAGPTEFIITLRENGAGYQRLSREAAPIVGHPINPTTMQRHLAHLRELETPQETEDALAGPKLGDLELLDLIIQRAAANSKAWKPSHRDMLDAIKLKHSLTGNSAFQDMLDAMNAGLDLSDDEEDGIEAPEAVLAPEEREEPLPEPLLTDV
jgi:hypothetical protein